MSVLGHVTGGIGDDRTVSSVSLRLVWMPRYMIGLAIFEVDRAAYGEDTCGEI